MTTWSRARLAQRRVPAPAAALRARGPARAALSCPRCDLPVSRERWYSSSKPPDDQQPPAVILASPPPASSLSSGPSAPTARPPAQANKYGSRPSAAAATETAQTTETDKTAAPASAAKEADATTDASASSLPSFIEARRSALGARFSRFMDDLQTRYVSASQALSDLTGYTAIEHIKAHNVQLENDLAAAQAALRVARRTYQAVNERRAATQREVTTLLARKDSWAPPDLERFTVLYRQDHELETSAQRAVEQLKEAEADEQRLSAALTSGILKRYHEEQVWSDRIRRQSTWGTWGLMGINVLLFLVLQVFAEPWRRRRLMRGIAEAESGVLEDVRKELADVRETLATVNAVSAAAAAAASSAEAATTEISTDAASEAEATEPSTAALALDSLPSMSLRLSMLSMSWPTSWHDIVACIPNPARWKAWFQDLSSERTVNMRMRDVLIVALHSVFAGAALGGGLVLALR